MSSTIENSGSDGTVENAGTDRAERLSRRRTIKRVLTAGTVAYVAPMILASVTPVSAQASHPECVGATCANFLPCSSQNPDCICVTLSSGGGFCVPGSTSCNVTGPCGPAPGFTCPANNVCAIDTCCGFPVCVPVALGAQCPTVPAPSSNQKLPTFPSNTIGRR